MGLKIKVFSLLSLLIITSLMISSYILIQQFEDHHTAFRKNELERIGHLLQRDIEKTMLAGRPEALQAIMENYQAITGLYTVRIIDYNGNILKSAKFQETGLKSEYFLRFRNKSGDTLYYLKPVKSTETCATCHGKKEELGLIELRYHMDELLSMRKKLNIRGASSIIAIFLIVSGVMLIIINLFIFRPVKGVFDLIERYEPERIDNKVDIMEYLYQTVEHILEKLKALRNVNSRLETEISELKTELKYKKKLEEMNMEMQYTLKELESTNKALYLTMRETKNRLSTIETSLARLKKTGNLVETFCETREIEEVLKNFIKYIVDLLSAEKGIIFLKQNTNDLIFNYISGYGFSVDLSEYEKDTITAILHNGRHRMDIVPDSGNHIIATPVKIKEMIIGGVVVESRKDSMFSQHDLDTLIIFSNHLSAVFKNLLSFEKFSKGYLSVFEGITTDLLESNGFYRGGRLSRLKKITVELGKRFGFSSRELSTLEQASALCDIGKLMIPHKIFNKKGPLTTEEFNILKTHPIKGAGLFDGMLFNDLKTTILHHHERYDGSGYPDGLSGDDIEIKARIISLTDAFEAMTSHRPYRPALSIKETFEEIERNAGSQFDPLVVKQFFELLREKPSLLIEVGYSLEKIIP